MGLEDSVREVLYGEVRIWVDRNERLKHSHGTVLAVVMTVTALAQVNAGSSSTLKETLDREERERLVRIRNKSMIYFIQLLQYSFYYF